MAFCAARAGQPGAWARGVLDAVRGARQALAARQPLSAEAYARFGAICAHRPGVVSRARRHWRERLI